MSFPPSLFRRLCRVLLGLLSLTHLRIAQAGLPNEEDGFSPCSMWVLLLMLSVLASLKDRLKKAKDFETKPFPKA